MPNSSLVTSLAELEALYDPAVEASILKEADRIVPVYRPFVEAAPFATLATNGPDGLDCSPRGDGPGFVTIADDKTLLLPDRRGNNRIDSLRNILHDPRVALLFLIPGIGETLRVNGRAAISTDKALLDRFTVSGRAPKSVLVIHVETVFFQCSRAIVRSQLWSPESQVPRDTLPSAGQMLAALSDNRVGGAVYDRSLPERVVKTLY